jgi:hypothetical protein
MIAVLAVTAGGAVAVTRTSALRSAPAPQAPTAPPAVAVVAALVQSHDVPIYLRGVGTVIAYNNVLIRSQITEQSSIRRSPIVTATRRTWRTPRSTSIATPSSRSKDRSRNSLRIRRRPSKGHKQGPQRKLPAGEQGPAGR